MISKVSNFSSPMSLFSKRGLKGTLSNPGISGVDIYNSGQTSNGWYYIQTSTMSSPKQVYCNMTDEGGGWMLICYTTNYSTVGATQGARYPNVWQNGQGTLNRMSVSTMDLWYHSGQSQCTQVMKMASPTASMTPILSNMVIANKVVYSNPGNLTLVNYINDTYTITSTLALNGVWSSIKGHTLMTGTLSVNAPRDWIYSNSLWWTVCGPSTQLLSDGRSGNAQGSGSWTNPSSNALYGMANVSTTTNSLRSDINTYAVYIK